MTMFQEKVQKVNMDRVWKSFGPVVLRYRFEFLLMFFLVITASACARWIPFLIGSFIDKVITPKDKSDFVLYILIIFLLETLSLVFNFFQVYLFQKLGIKVISEIRIMALESIFKMTMGFFAKQPVGRLITKANNDVSQVSEVFSDGVVKVFIQTVVLISIVVSMAVISIPLMFVTLSLTPFFTWLIIYITNKIKNSLRESKAESSILNSFTSETLSGIKTVQQFNLSSSRLKTYEIGSGKVTQTSLQSSYYYALMMPALNTFNASILSLTLLFGIKFVSQGDISIGSMIAFLLLALEFVHPFRDIIEKYQQFQNGLTSAERVVDLLQSPQENSYSVSANFDKNRINKIEFKNLSFKYEENLPLVLQDINITLKNGQSLGVIGRTGSGKTTLSQILVRLYEPPKETIFINDKPIESWSVVDLRQRILCLQQDIFVFKGTILENMTLGNGQIPETKVQQVVEDLELLKHLEKNNRTLDSHVEELGRNLSVGEKQLISFARILLLDPDVLLLDEATSNIDSTTEDLLQRALKKVMSGRISILIAHRLHTILNCSHVMALSNGKIIEYGPTEDLLENDSVLQDWLNFQLPYNPKQR